METIEQLKQDNVKLQERLNNAAKFFREQKEQIETLTKENDELKHDADSFNSLQESYENTIKSKDQAYKVLQDTYNEVFAENKRLKEQTNNADEIENLNKQLNEYELKLANGEQAYGELHNKYEEIKELHDGDLKRYNELEDNYENLQNSYQELKKQEENFNLRADEAELKLKVAKQEYDNKLQEQEKVIEDLKKENKETEEQYNKVLSSYEKDLNENKEKLSSVSKQYDVLETQYKSLKEDNNALKEKYNNLNKLYDDLENEKLSYEADYNNIKEKYEEITSESDINKDYTDRLETTISDIWVLCNNVINPEPDKTESKEISNKNKVQKNSTGNQFMSDANGMNI